MLLPSFELSLRKMSYSRPGIRKGIDCGNRNFIGCRDKTD